MTTLKTRRVYVRTAMRTIGFSSSLHRKPILERDGESVCHEIYVKISNFGMFKDCIRLKKPNSCMVYLCKSQWPIRAGAYSGFSTMKQLGIFPPPTPWDGMLVHRRYLFVYLGGERQGESQLCCPKPQHNVLDQCSNPDRSIRRGAHWPWGHRAITNCMTRHWSRENILNCFKLKSRIPC